MNISKLIDILRFPHKKGNGLNPWYRILWGFLLLPFIIVFGIGFYVCIVLFHLSFYTAEEFRKTYTIKLY
jgi:hypothetical protein